MLLDVAIAKEAPRPARARRSHITRSLPVCRQPAGRARRCRRFAQPASSEQVQSRKSADEGSQRGIHDRVNTSDRHPACVMARDVFRGTKCHVESVAFQNRLCLGGVVSRAPIRIGKHGGGAAGFGGDPVATHPDLALQAFA